MICSVHNVQSVKELGGTVIMIIMEKYHLKGEKNVNCTETPDILENLRTSETK